MRRAYIHEAAGKAGSGAPRPVAGKQRRRFKMKFVGAGLPRSTADTVLITFNYSVAIHFSFLSFLAHAFAHAPSSRRPLLISREIARARSMRAILLARNFERIVES